MTHLPYVAATYALGFGVPALLALLAARRLQLVRRRLALLDPRGMAR